MLRFWLPQHVALVALAASMQTVEPLSPCLKVTVAEVHLDLDHKQGSAFVQDSTLGASQQEDSTLSASQEEDHVQGSAFVQDPTLSAAQAVRDEAPSREVEEDLALQSRQRIPELLTPVALILGLRPEEGAGGNATLDGAGGTAPLSNDTSFFSCARLDPCVLGITKMVWSFLLTGLSMVAMFIAMVLTLGFAKQRGPRREQPPEVQHATTEFSMPAAGEELLAKAAQDLGDKSLDRHRHGY